MNDKTQYQTGGDGSQNVQAGPNGNITINNGLSIQDAKEIVLLLIEQDFSRFSEKAVAIARERAEQMVDNFLQKIVEKNPNLIQAVESPGMQMALVKAQQEHVKTGDNDIRDILVNALVQRAETPDRGILQISIDESLIAIGKLTMRQINILTLCLILHHTRAALSVVTRKVEGASPLESAKNILISIYKLHVNNFLDKATLNYSNYVHISSCNCGDVFMGSSHFVKNILRNYPGIFCKGFRKEELLLMLKIKPFVDNDNYPELFVSCLNNNDLFQLPFVDFDEMDKWVISHGISLEIGIDFRLLMSERVFNEEEAIAQILSWGEEMVRLFDAWNNTGLKSLILNNIGKAVAAMNYNRVYNTDISLSMWVAE